MDLSIIIVNWNSKDYLQQCLDSIRSHRIEFDCEILVIDSGSFDGCREMLQQHYPEVIFIQSDYNLGFAKANNEAFKTSQGRNILFLNPDTEVEKDAILQLYANLESLPDAGVVGPRLLNTDRTVQTSCIRSFPTILNEALDCEALRQRFPRSRLWGMAALFDESATPSEVNAISGACMMMSRLVFEKMGMFNTGYFMYSEDIDLCFKIQRAGFKNYFVPSATIIHHGGASSDRSHASTFASVLSAESQFRFFRMNRTTVYAWAYRLTVILASIARIAAAGLLAQARPVAARSDAWGRVITKWLSKLRWALGLEGLAKTH
jgi:hypothetical protein